MKTELYSDKRTIWLLDVFVGILLTGVADMMAAKKGLLEIVKPDSDKKRLGPYI